MESNLYRFALAKVMAVLTRHPRYIPILGIDFEWSNKSWTHNAFRVFELIFGRRQGIRLESTCGIDGDGTEWVIVHTFEAAVAYIETYIRSLFTLPKFRFVKVYIPQLVPVGFGPPTGMPYFFAIAYDTSGSGVNTPSNSVTWSHTCTGSNLTLTVEGCQNNIPTSSAATTTYNTVTVPDIKTLRDTTQNTFTTLSALANPATGANSAVFTTIDNGVSAFSMSLTGTSSTPAGASASTPDTRTTTPSQALVTTVDNSWIVDNVQFNAAGATATGSGQTKRVEFVGVGGNRFYGSTMTTTTAGSYTIGYSGSLADWTYIAAEIKQSTGGGAATVISSTLPFMGAG